MAWRCGKCDGANVAAHSPDLRGPVEVQLARAVKTVPAPNALAGGTIWEPKLDGYLH